MITRKIYDVFPFFNELNLLDVRLQTIGDLVDYFVICEATTTFSGKTKPLIYLENAHLFAGHKTNIIHLICDEDHPEFSPFEREWFQRDYFKTKLNALLQADDILIYSDVDEIPTSQSIISAVEQLDNGYLFAHLAQDLYYYYVDLVEVSGSLISAVGEYPSIKGRHRKWLGPVVTHWRNMENLELKDLRSPSMKANGVRIQNGGWHFSFMGSDVKVDAVTRALVKMDGYAHQEFNTDKIKRKMLRRIRSGKDIFGRRTAKFKRLEGLTHLPECIQKNPEQFSELICP